jgi:nicotinamide riboside kinase
MKQTTWVIAVLGAESTGKTELVDHLRKQLPAGSQFVAEPLRAFCNQHNRVPTMAEQMTLMQAHMDTIDRYSGLSKGGLVVCDCAPITTALYSRLYYDDFSLMARATQFHQTRFQLTFYLAPEFGWVPDANPIMRDSPHAQARFDIVLNDWFATNPSLSVLRLSGNTVTRVAAANAAIMDGNARGPDLR